MVSIEEEEDVMASCTLSLGWSGMVRKWETRKVTVDTESNLTG